MICPKIDFKSSLILEDYIYMVDAIANNFNFENVRNIRDSEIFGYLSLELVSCATRYDSNKGSFEKYLSSHLFNKAIDFLRKNGRKKRQGSFLGNFDIENIPQRTQNTEELFSIELLPKLLSSSPSDSLRDLEDRSILMEYYLGKKTVLELSKKYDTTKVTIYNRIKRSIKKIREIHGLDVYS